MANPGYGKRSASDQRPRTPHDFAFLPTRERYVAGFIDHLPEAAAMGVKPLARQLPLYGQQAIGSALNALAVAGHLRRVRCEVTGREGQVRWVFRTFWSRTARDNEWWTAYLAADEARFTGSCTQPGQAPAAAASQAPEAEAASPPPPWVPEPTTDRQAPDLTAPDADAAPESVSVPQQRTATSAPPAEPDPAPRAGPSPAYLALAQLGRIDRRVGLSADDCAALEGLAAAWLERGVSSEYVIHALTSGLPLTVDSPVGFVRRRLESKIPPHQPATAAPPQPGAPVHRVLVECTACGVPGRPEALPDGLCRSCRPGAESTEEPTREQCDIGAYVSQIRDRLKLP